MTQLVVTLKDQSYLPNIRRILKSLVGVEKVTTAKTDTKTAARKKRLSRYEQSLLDLEEGRVNSLVMGISKTKPRMRHLINVKEPHFFHFEA